MDKRRQILKNRVEQLEAGYDHLPDIKENMAVYGKLVKFHEKWLIAEVERFRKKIDELQKTIDKFNEAV